MLLKKTVIIGLILTLAAPLLAGEKWEKFDSDDGLTIYRREKKGSDIKEIKSVKIIKQKASVLMRVVSDFEHFSDFLPYVKKSHVVRRESVKVFYGYQLLAFPLISDRDMYIRVADVSSASKSGQQPAYYKSEWHVAKGGPKDQGVRLKVNDGYWRFDPLDGGKKTRITYYVYTDPGGMVPSFLANKANTVAIPDVLKALEKRSHLKQYQDPPAAKIAPAPAPASAPAAVPAAVPAQ